MRIKQGDVVLRQFFGTYLHVGMVTKPLPNGEAIIQPFRVGFRPKQRPRKMSLSVWDRGVGAWVVGVKEPVEQHPLSEMALKQ